MGYCRSCSDCATPLASLFELLGQARSWNTCTHEVQRITGMKEDHLPGSLYCVYVREANVKVFRRPINSRGMEKIVSPIDDYSISKCLTSSLPNRQRAP